MDALIPAFVAAVLAEIGDKSGWLAALIAARFGRTGPVILGAVIAAALASAITAMAGGLIQPLLTGNARLLFLGLALILSGIGAFFPARMPDGLAGWRTGAFLTSLLGLFIIQFGEGTQFIVAALAVNAKLPALAAVGATLGIAITTGAMALAGPELARRWPLVPIRRAIGGVFLVSGLLSGLAALRLL